MDSLGRIWTASNASPGTYQDDNDDSVAIGEGAGGGFEDVPAGDAVRLPLSPAKSDDAMLRWELWQETLNPNLNLDAAIT